MTSQPIVVAVMGPSGSGKTNFINKLTETREEVHQLRWYSRGIEEYTVNLAKDRQYVFVDTPGFGGTSQPNGVILYTIADWLEKRYRANVKLSGIIYTHHITDGQISGSVCRNLDMFAQLCRDRAAGGVRLVTTMWDEVRDQELAESKVDQLEQNLWRPLIDAGARHRRFEENSSRCAWEIIEDLTGGAHLIQDDAQAQGDPASGDMDKLKIPFSKRIALFFSKKTHLKSAITPQFSEDGHWVAANDYVIFVVGPTEAEKTWFTSQLCENHDEGRHLHTENVKAWRCSLGSGSDNIIVVDTPSFHSDRNNLDAENRMKGWLGSKFTKNCHSAVLFLHSLDSDSLDGDMPMSWHLETFAKTFRNGLAVPSDIYVVPTSNPTDILPSQAVSGRLSQLKTMTRRLNRTGKRDWRASIFPGIFEGKPETAWNAALLLLKGIARTQTKEFVVSLRSASKPMPPKSPDSCLALKDIADILFGEFKQKERSCDLDAIIMLGQTALEFTPLKHPQRLSVLISLAGILSERSNKEGRKEDLDELITLKRAASESTPPDEPQRETILRELDAHLSERFKRTHSRADLEEIISLRRAALERIPQPDRCRALLNLANALHEQFQKEGTENSISEAVSLARTAFGLCPPWNSDRAMSQEHLASYLETTFKEFKKKERDCDLDAMISLQQIILESTLPQHPQRLSVLIGLAGLLSERFNKEGRKEDLDELITLKRAASEYMSPDEPQRQTILLKFDNHLLKCLKRMDSAVDLEEIVCLRRAALECTSQPNRCGALRNLADALHEQFQKQGKENSLAEAVSLARAASGLCPEGHPDYALSRCHLESYLATTRLVLKSLAKPPSKESEQKERDRDLDAMITLGQTALELTPPQYPQHLSVLIDLAALILERFNEEGRREDLDELITLKRAAWEYMPPDEPQRQTLLLELDDYLSERVKRTDSTVDLEEIISLRRAALKRIPPPSRCGALLKLADALHEQYQEQGMENSLAEAVSLTGAASGLCPPEHPDYALSRCQLEGYLTTTQLALHDLANPCSEESKKKERDRDRDAMINLGQTALEFTPLQHPQRLSVLISLAGILSERSNKEGRKEDLDELITLKRAASESIPPDEPQRETILRELDAHLSERFKRTHSRADLEEIISLRRAALERIPQPDRCRALLKLADALHEQYKTLGTENSISEAVSLARTALDLCSPENSDHALSQEHLAGYLETMVGKRESSVHMSRPVAGPSNPDIKASIKKLVSGKLEKHPLRLLHTSTGVLCDRDAQIFHFESSPQYQHLLLLASSLDNHQLETEIDNVISEYFEYATLSHRWGSGEPLLRDIEDKSIYDLRGTGGQVKLQKFCIIALRHHFQWAWSDTCCIDKDSSAELQEAIVSMFSWYRWSSLTIVYLSDVFGGGSLAGSVWFTRGWTLQELLASRTVLFYTDDWSPYSKSSAVDHKSDPALLEELQNVTGISKQHLMNFCPGMDDARFKLHWASRRRTTRPEDIAYSLFGIFQVHLPIFYGEFAQNAVGRLLAEIISHSGDVSVLDWVGKSSSFNSCFPTDLAPYQILPHLQFIPSDPSRRNNFDFEKAQKLYNQLAGLQRARCVNKKLTLPSTVHPVTAVEPQSSSDYSYEIHASRLRPLNVTLSAKLDENVGSYILVRPWHPKSLEQQTCDVDAVWKLLEQLEQPFNALLLKRLLHNEYTRIACDCTITARIQDLDCILDSEVLIPEIV